MASQIPTLEAAPGQGAAAPPKKGKLGLILMIVAVLVLGGGGAAAYLLLGGHKDPKAAAAAQKAKDAEKTPALYVALDPPFVVNFEAEQLVRFLQVTVQVMSRDPATVELIKTSDPVVRNDLLLLLGTQSYQTISSREGKEKLRLQALEAVRKVVTSAGGKPEKVEAIYFTSFVMQ
jgi:flagellar FliL protein